VGYREFVRSKAKELGLTGWVRNLSDQRVEILGQGLESDLKKLIEQCEKGPFLAEVTSVAVEWQEAEKQYPDFKRLPTV
jgi:acylphosphatase